MENREELGLTHPWNQEQKYNKVMEPRVEGGYPQGTTKVELCYLWRSSWIIIILAKRWQS